jgi:hypothetical protein
MFDESIFLNRIFTDDNALGRRFREFGREESGREVDSMCKHEGYKVLMDAMRAMEEQALKGLRDNDPNDARSIAVFQSFAHMKEIIEKIVDRLVDVKKPEELEEAQAMI